MKGFLKFYIDTIKVAMPVYTTLFLIRVVKPDQPNSVWDLAADLTKIVFFPITMPVEMRNLYLNIRQSVGRQH